MSGAVVLSAKALNRATLHRQMLLERASVTPIDAIERLVGMQAQNPLDPYAGLWSRLADFEVDDVGRALEDRRLVRIVVMRGTIHLVSAQDALAIRPLVQPVLDAEIAHHSQFAPLLVGVDVSPILPVAEALLAARPMTGGQLRACLAERFPEHDAAALAYACRCFLPLVQVPPRGVWGRTLQVTSTPLTHWVGAPLAPATLDALVQRYLGGYGPASVADAAAWSRLTGLGAVFERLEPQLTTYRDERGRVLHDIADGPLPDADTPAPVRFLPEYDNVLLSHADRSRFGDSAAISGAAGPVKGTALIDGRVQAVWHTETQRRGASSTLVVEHVRLSAADLTSLEAEAHTFARFWIRAAELEPTVRLVGIEPK